jgi:sugar phosphate permease
MAGFLRENLRWVAGGFLLTLFSSFGQTFFISLSAGNIRAEYGLSHGQFGTLYMIATLASALSLTQVGKLVDRWNVAQTVWLTVALLAVACLAMALSSSIFALVAVIYLLRLFGQGMMSQIAFTAMGRWFAAQRGRAVSISAIGVNLGEASFPFLFVVIAAAIGWRNTWIAAAIVLVVVALPAIHLLLRIERQPRSTDATIQPRQGRDWTLGQTLRDPLFYLMLIGVLAPPFIGTTIFFHQVYLVELRAWSLEAFAASFTLMSLAVITFALITGWLVDRYSAVRILPVYLLPLSAACFVLGSFEGQWSAFAFMALLGVSYGFSTTLFGALWPEVYGTVHLGSIRSMIVAIMVLATAVGPGLTGWLIDLGVPYPLQINVMGVWCFAGAAAMTVASRALLARNRPPAIAT